MFAQLIDGKQDVEMGDGAILKSTHQVSVQLRLFNKSTSLRVYLWKVVRVCQNGAVMHHSSIV